MVPGLLVLAGIATLLLYFAVQETRKGGWPVANAELVDSRGELVTEFSLLGRSDSSQVRVAYAIEVGGRSYDGNETMQTDAPEELERFRRLVDTRSLKVRYDPADPSRSYIDHGEGRRWVLGLWATAIAFAALFAYGVHRYRLAEP